MENNINLNKVDSLQKIIIENIFKQTDFNHLLTNLVNEKIKISKIFSAYVVLSNNSNFDFNIVCKAKKIIEDSLE